MSPNIIGGEFGIKLSYFRHKHTPSLFWQKECIYSSGRAALYQILKYVKQNFPHVQKIWLPEYLCSSILYVVELSGFEWNYYSLNSTLHIEQNHFEDLDYTDSVVLIINYFGLIDTRNDIAYLRNLNSTIIIIEDDVQSLFSMLKDSDADFRFTSFRKTIAIPDGGWIISNHNVPKPLDENTFAQYKYAASVLKEMRNCDMYNDSVYLDLFHKGEELINENNDKGISHRSIKLLDNIDLEKVDTIRKRNANYLIKGLKDIGLNPMLEMSNGMIPLFVPLYLENRDTIREKLRNNRIFCPVHWPIDENYPITDKMIDMRQHELSLIVDQRYSLADMKSIINVVKEAIW